jgi:hypothetical protein
MFRIRFFRLTSARATFRIMEIEATFHDHRTSITAEHDLRFNHKREIENALTQDGLLGKLSAIIRSWRVSFQLTEKNRSINMSRAR